MARMNYAGSAAALRNAPPDVAAWIASNRGMANRVAVSAFPYFSTVRLATARTGAGPFTYTASIKTVKCFNYKIGDVMDGAGFPAGTIATEAETNLLKASETRDSADVLIWGISCEVAKGEPKLLRQFFRETAVRLALSGTDNYLLGPLSFFPQVGGMFGAERSKLQAGALNEQSGPLLGAITNGNPNAGSFFRLPEPLLWESIGSGKKDTSLVMSLTPQRAFTETSTDRAAVAGAAPGASGQVEAFTSPADGADGTFVDVRIRLHATSVNEVSRNG